MNTNYRTELRNQGYDVFFKTRRFLKASPELVALPEIKQEKLGPLVDPRGGEVEVEIISKDRNRQATGIAICSRKDNFNSKRGIQIAVGRALRGLEVEA